MTRPDVKMSDEMTRHYSALSLAGAAQNLSSCHFPKTHMTRAHARAYVSRMAALFSACV